MYTLRLTNDCGDTDFIYTDRPTGFTIGEELTAWAKDMENDAFPVRVSWVLFRDDEEIDKGRITVVEGGEWR